MSLKLALGSQDENGRQRQEAGRRQAAWPSV